MLSPAQISQYENDGFLVLPGFKSAAQMRELRRAAADIVAAHDIERYKAVFSTGRQRQKQGDEFQRYFINSANTVRCFFEEKTFDSEGDLIYPLAQSINKIGHAMHDLDPVFGTFSRGEKLDELAEALGLVEPQIWQSMYIFKQPRIGGQVDWHQDASFFHTSPISVTTFWFALDDAHLDNGCLWVEKGGHKGPLRQIFVRGGEGAVLRTIDQTPWPAGKKVIPLEVKAGSLVCFHGKLPHYSAANTSNKARHAYTLHVTNGRSVYSKENWIQRDKDFPATGFKVH